MKENLPLKEVPLPDPMAYRADIIRRHGIAYPLRSPGAMSHVRLPAPLNRVKKGWPWDHGSDLKTQENGALKISVVIPSYQQGAYIEEAIRSVLLQNYPAVELIIIDGGSSDETLLVADHYRDYISLFVSEPDKGQSEAINKGFAMASGDLYYWLNSDDLLAKNVFSRVADLFNKNPDLDIIYGDGFSLDESTGAMTTDSAPWVLERYLRVGGIVLSHSVIWRARVHCPVWEDLHCAMDAELWLRLFTERKSRHCLFPIGIARKHPEQKTSGTGKWASQWQIDYEKYIWAWYPGIRHWTRRSYEYRIVQRIFRIWRRLTGHPPQAYTG